MHAPGLCPYFVDLGVHDKRKAVDDLTDGAARAASGHEPRPYAHEQRPYAGHEQLPYAHEQRPYAHEQQPYAGHEQRPPAPVPADFLHERRPSAASVGHPPMFSRHHAVFDARGQRESMGSILRMLQHVSRHIASAVQTVLGSRHAAMDEWSTAATNEWWHKLCAELVVARDMMPGFVYTVPFDSNGSEFGFCLKQIDFIIQGLTPHAHVLKQFNVHTDYMTRMFSTDQTF